MLVKKKLEETVELKLPAFFQSGYTLYMITEEETIVEIWESTSYGVLIATCIKEAPSHAGKISSAVNGTPISEYVFFKLWHQAMDHLESTIVKPLFTKPNKN